MFLPFRIHNWHQFFFPYQLLLLSCVDLPPQGMTPTIIITILTKIPPVLLPTVFHSDILLFIQVRIPLFWYLYLQHIRWDILNTTQTIKQIETHTSFKHETLFKTSIPINCQRFTLFFFGEVWYWLIHIKAYLLFWTYTHKRTRIHLSPLPTFKLN